MAPLVSILIPCHNAAPWLAATIESALAQTWSSCEVIVVDDGSTDESLAVARQYGSRGVRTIQQSNRGASAARNAAIAASSGAYLQFLDADDLLTPDKIAGQMERLRSASRQAMASCRWGRFANDPQTANFIDAAVFRDFAPLEFLLLHVGAGAMMHPAAWLTPRTIAIDAGGWDETLSLNDDGEYFCRILLHADSIVFSPVGASLYRTGVSRTLSGRRDRRALESLYRSVELVNDHISAHDTSTQARAALANYWKRLEYELYPEAPDLSQRANAKVTQLGGSTLPPPVGRRQQWLGRWIGWKLSRRISRWLTP